MQETVIKEYFDKTYKSDSIDVSKLVMEKISIKTKVKTNVKPKGKGIRVKYVLALIIIMVTILGCGIFVRKEFVGPDGKLTFALEFVDRSLENEVRAQDIFKELDLNEGASVKIILNGVDEVFTFQEPWLIDTFEEVQWYSEQLSLSLPKFIGENYFAKGSFVNNSGISPLDLTDNLSDFDIHEGYKIAFCTENDSLSSVIELSYGNQETGVDVMIQSDSKKYGASDDAQTMIVASYSNTKLSDNITIIHVDGYEGAKVQDENCNIFQTYYRNTYIYLTDKGKTFKETEFETFVMDLFK